MIRVAKFNLCGSLFSFYFLSFVILSQVYPIYPKWVMLPSRVNLSYIYKFLGPKEKDREHLKAAFFSTRNQPKVNRTQGRAKEKRKLLIQQEQREQEPRGTELP